MWKPMQKVSTENTQLMLVSNNTEMEIVESKVSDAICKGQKEL
jgi:hypothetical protein